jgi:adenylate cyclase
MDLKRFHLGLKYYRARRWDNAEREILALSQANPQKMIYQIYLERIVQFRQQPPPPDWDGSYIHTSK